MKNIFAKHSGNGYRSGKDILAAQEKYRNEVKKIEREFWRIPIENFCTLLESIISKI